MPTLEHQQFSAVFFSRLVNDKRTILLALISFNLSHGSMHNFEQVLPSRRPAPWGNRQHSFFKDLGRRLAVRFKDQRESDFLFQRLSLAILRGNAFSILQSYSD